MRHDEIMSNDSRLPLLLQWIDFEPLIDQSTQAESIHCQLQNRKDSSAFKLRVEDLARQYLCGQELFIWSATLRGPFKDGWLNPWTQTTQGAGVEQSDDGKNADNEYGGHHSEYLTSTSGQHFPLQLPRTSFVAVNQVTVNQPDQPAVPVEEEPITGLYDTHSHRRRNSSASDDVQRKGAPPNEAQTIRERIINRAMRNIPETHSRTCAECGTQSTTRWMKGPTGPATLCGACGMRFYRKSKKEKTSKPTKSTDSFALSNNIPTFAGVNQASAVPEDSNNGEIVSHQSAITSISEEPKQRLRAFSQPEFATRSLSLVEGLFKKSPASSLPSVATRPKMRHCDIMESVFPGGLLVDVYRRYGQLIDLFDKDATARLTEILKLPKVATFSNKAAPIKALTKHRQNRKIRVMNFDTPVITRQSRNSSGQATLDFSGLRNGLEPRLIGESGHTPRSKTVLDNENGIHHETGVNIGLSSSRRFLETMNVPQENQIDSATRVLQDSPLVSTQAALLQAYDALQEELKSPQKPSPRPALQDKTNTSVINTPFRKFNEMGANIWSIDPSQKSSTANNTQALFDQFTSFGSSPSLDVPKSDNKKKKRASFASEPDTRGKEGADAGEWSTQHESTPLARRDGSSNLRKSALKKSGNKASISNSSFSSDSLRGRGSGYALPFQALISRCEDEDADGAGGVSDMEIESFLRDANSLLNSSSE